MYCVHCGALVPEAGRDQNAITCSACGHVSYGQPAPCVSVLVVWEGRVLLGRRVDSASICPGLWCLPCGHIERAESFLDAARREVLEEVNLKIRPLAIINAVTNHFPRDVHSLVVVLLAEPLTFTIRAGDDMAEAAWFPLEGPYPEMAFQADRHIICQYRKYGGALGIPLACTKTVFSEPGSAGQNL